MRKHIFIQMALVGKLEICEICDLVKTPLVVARGCPGVCHGIIDVRFQTKVESVFVDGDKGDALADIGVLLMEGKIKEAAKLRDEYENSARGGRSSY